MDTRISRRARFVALASAALALVLAVPGPASALSDFWDIQPIFEWVDPGETVGDTFNIKTPGTDCILSLCDSGGFVPGTEPVVEAYVTFIFDEWGDLTYRISLGEGVQLFEANTTSFGLTFEFETVNDAAIFDLNQDGELAWSLTNLDVPLTEGSGGHQHYLGCGHYGGDSFKLKYAKLHATPIPEPGAALLFAVGFGVVGTAARKRARQS
jgi:hypothetical protein